MNELFVFVECTGRSRDLSSEIRVSEDATTFPVPHELVHAIGDYMTKIHCYR